MAIRILVLTVLILQSLHIIGVMSLNILLVLTNQLIILRAQLFQVQCSHKRSIDLIAAHSLISDTRLPREVTPNSYILDLHPYPEEGSFTGRIKINITWQETTDRITLHAQEDLVINHSEVSVTQYAPDDETYV